MSIQPPVLPNHVANIASLTKQHVEEARDHNEVVKVKKKDAAKPDFTGIEVPNFSGIPGHISHGKAKEKDSTEASEVRKKREKDTQKGSESDAEGEKGKLPIYPEDHQVGMKVPRGGSDCDKCKYLVGPRKCGEGLFIQWNGSDRIPDLTDEYCCDFFTTNGTEKV